ncbi:MAG: zinc ribbon domain-containing protein [Porticoccaceae bacterium]|jgi:putative FmdB family regulatory protein
MPIYAYRCQACDHELEALRKISDPPLVDCPACSKSELKKLLTAPSFRLSGSGWYETDFKTGDKKNLAGDQSAASDSGGKTPDGGSSSADKAAAPAG